MDQEYEVWFWDIHDILNAQLSNPNFNGHIDYSPKYVHDKKGDCVFNDLMSGQWAWEQVVCGCYSLQTINFTYLFRIYWPKSQRTMVPECLFLSYLEVTRPWFW
jgi:hypothetical protein